MNIHCTPIPNHVSLTDRNQVLIDNLVVAANACNSDLCLRAISAILFWNPGTTLQMVDEYCTKHNVPLVLIADTTAKWDAKTCVCVALQDCFTPCPYQVRAICASRQRQKNILTLFVMDPTRPKWMRDNATNLSYLLKCGMLIRPQHATFAHQIRETDTVMAGTVKLEASPNSSRGRIDHCRRRATPHLALAEMPTRTGPSGC